MKLRTAEHLVVGTWTAGLVTWLAMGACATNDVAVPLETDGGTQLSNTDAAPASDAGNGDECATNDACAPVLVDCRETDFCPVALPIPNDVALNAVWGSSSTDIWAVGTRGIVLHGDGTNFSPVTTGLDTIYLSVWGTSTDEVWLASSRAPVHGTRDADGAWNWAWVLGDTWSSDWENQGRTWSVWGTSPTDVWMAGFASQRFGDAASFWSKTTTEDGGVHWKTVDAYSFGYWALPSIRAIWGSAPDALWGVGQGGQAFLYQSAKDDLPAGFYDHDSQTASTLESIWGSRADDVWTVGEGGVIRHFTNAPSGDFDLVDSPTFENLHGVWGTSSTDVWAVGDHGTILHYDGKTWSFASTGLAGDVRPDLFAVWGTGEGEVWVVGQGTALHRTSENRRQR